MGLPEFELEYSGAYNNRGIPPSGLHGIRGDNTLSGVRKN
jgi:hypothetical protein